MESFYIGAYWGSRGESLMQVRDKVLQTFQRLAEIDEQFLNWYEGGNSRKEALENRIVFNNETIEKLCLETVRKGELDKNGFAKMGFLFGLWTGHEDDESSSITFTVGTAFTSPHLFNSCVLSIPFEGEGRERLLQIEKAKKIIAVFVEVWNPDYAVLTSHQLRDKLNIANNVGWITYRKTIKSFRKISNVITSERFADGHLLYLNMPGGKFIDFNLAHKLTSVKEML